MELKTLYPICALSGIAVFTGVMLNIGLTLGAYWKSLPPADFLEWFKTNSHFIARTIPFITLPTIMAAIATIWINWDMETTRNLWLVSFACMLGIALITFTWHLPANAQFVAKQIALQEVPDKLNMWLMLHSLRIFFGFIATIFGVLALQQ